MCVCDHKNESGMTPKIKDSVTWAPLYSITTPRGCRFFHLCALVPDAQELFRPVLWNKRIIEQMAS